MHLDQIVGDPLQFLVFFLYSASDLPNRSPALCAGRLRSHPMSRSFCLDPKLVIVVEIRGDLEDLEDLIDQRGSPVVVVDRRQQAERVPDHDGNRTPPSGFLTQITAYLL